MCLDKGTKKKYKQPIKRVIFGYKVFDRLQDGLGFWFRTNEDSLSVPRRRWIKASSGPGFHIFKKRKDALNWWKQSNSTVRKIKVRNITHRGKQCDWDVYLAQEIYVP